MNGVEEIKKFKELLDAGIITEEEFEKKKKEVLSGSVRQESAAVTLEVELEAKDKKVQKAPMNKAALKKILIGVGIIATLAVAIFAGQKIVEKSQQSKRAAALETAIASIMDDYGLSGYTVKYVDYGYDVFAPGFESLTNGEALSCLKELDSVSVDDPCGDGEIDFGRTEVHPGLDVWYSYWRVSSTTVLLNEMHGGGYKTPGIYCNQYETRCVYACES